LGNFYANIALKSVDTSAVVPILESHRRRAFVSTVGSSTFVYDERCDAQDMGELRSLAETLSRACGAPALAACNHDDDVLWLAFAENGRVPWVYDSYPGYFDGGSDEPAVQSCARLCAAFGSDGGAAEVEALLSRRHSDVGFELDRHQKLATLLGIDPAAAVLGYRYVSKGETGDQTVIAVGGATTFGTTASRPGFVPAVAATPLADPVAAIPLWQAAVGALALSEVDLPTEAAPLIGQGRMNGWLAVTRLQQYVDRNGLIEVGDANTRFVRGDAHVQALLGIRDFPYHELALLLVKRLGLSVLTDELQAAIVSGDQKTARRIGEALSACFRQMDGEPLEQDEEA
jgi:hypothetical protein